MGVKRFFTRTLIIWAAVISATFLALNIIPGQTGNRHSGESGRKGSAGSGFISDREKSRTVCEVYEVIDGDTIIVYFGSRKESVRLIGIDAPETKKDTALYGKKAAAYTEQLLAGQQVRLDFDVARRDKYGRLLAYVYTEQGDFVNALLVGQGYAQVMTVPPNVKYQALFRDLQKQARQSRHGLWAIDKYRMENPPISR